MRTTTFTFFDYLPEPLREMPKRRAAELIGVGVLASLAACSAALLTWSVADPSLNHATATATPIHNLLGRPGAVVADIAMQFFGLACVLALIAPAFWGWRLVTRKRLDRIRIKLALWLAGSATAAGCASLLPAPTSWPLPTGLGGVIGDAVLFAPRHVLAGSALGAALVGLTLAGLAILALTAAAGYHLMPSADADDAAPAAGGAPRRGAPERYDGDDEDSDGEPGFALVSIGAVIHTTLSLKSALRRLFTRNTAPAATPRPAPRAPWLNHEGGDFAADLAAFAPRSDARADPPMTRQGASAASAPPSRVAGPADALKAGRRAMSEAQLSLLDRDAYELPPLALLAEPKKLVASKISEDALEQNARLLEGVLDDFGVKGEIINVRPGPVVTLYELEPAPGIKSSRVIGLADDIARSMSAISARVAVVQGRNAIGVELPNQRRETVYLRELLASQDFEKTKHRLAIALGKTIGGEPVIVDLARMPHLLVAGTTGSGKSVAINTMVMSLLYRLKPEQCRLIMVDPKMLELSAYDGIPHLLTPVVTDPKKAVVALKWAVREMEDRYKKMSKLGVRNIDGFNARVAEAAAKGETIARTVQTGFDRETGEAIYEQEEMEFSELPYIVVVVDEMADLMMVAGKDIEGAIQRLAQMARAAGVHIIMATQRPSVDVITGTIKANFPTRVSFQVTSKIDSRTILGEQGAEQLLGQGDMLYMAGGGRISRVHGPFVADGEVERIVAHLKAQGQPEYLSAITEENALEDDEVEAAPAGSLGSMDAEEAGDYYDRAVNIVLRDRKCSTSYIQRRLSVGYNKAASLVERMEEEGVVGPANHAGKREILIGNGADRGPFRDDEDE
ncbi:MAG: DNA translocase FtsK 4TM domain-containing protein [Roseiarcus sp.]|jgi:S-DNA-T family DNA segregation ATPase FtsK/SpoIIIE